MSSNAIEAQGTLLKVRTSISPITFTTIPEVKSFTGPGGSAAVIDVTDLSSTAKEKRMGLQDEGQLSFTMNYLPDNSTHDYLRAIRAARTINPFQLIFTDESPATTWAFNAFVTGFSVSGAVDGVVEANVTLEITGAITET
jgi:predicted secreted protein